MTAKIASTQASNFDANKSEAFSNSVVNILNGGALALMISLGHRAGLFDVMVDLPPSSSERIAAAANLNERYVREWLGAMVTGGVVEVDANSSTFYLPPEHAAWLTRRAAPNNLAVFTQYIPLLSQVEDDILDCFRQGGGVPYERFPRFHEVMAEDSGQTVVAALFDHILPLAPGLTEQLERGISVLDVGCGRGRCVILLARRYPASRFVGVDLSAEAIAYATAEAARYGLDNVTFEVRDLSDFDQTAEPAQYDLVTTFDAVHDQARPRALLAGISRTLKTDGVYLMQDIHGSSHVHNNRAHPIGPLLYTISTMHCMTVSLAQNGEGLGTMWGQELAEQLLREAGFDSITIHRLEHDIQNDYYVVRKSHADDPQPTVFNQP